jgi:polysaccharide biosynthesis/export protein
MRLSDALRASGGPKPGIYLGQIIISRLNSDSSRSRIYSAFRDTTGAVSADIELSEDDEITVFSITEFRQERHVNIAGAVRRPGQYPYRESMTLRDLVLQAGGLHERALLTEAELARMPADRIGGKLAVTSRVPLDSTYLFERTPDGKYLGPPGVAAPRARAPEVTLQAYDNVLILEQPDWDMPRLVSLNGEVRLPGTYTLLNKSERLADLIRRAGGLTAQAYPAGIIFNRSRDQIGRIGVDLPRVLRDPRFRDNLQLEDGDNIFIPPYRSTVVVGGAVNSPVAVAYVPGRDIDWYIGAAGGPTAKAEAARAWVVQPNGSVESKRRRLFAPDSKPTPQPGSSVQVPEKDPNTRTDRLQTLASVAQVLASLVAIIAVASR